MTWWREGRDEGVPLWRRLTWPIDYALYHADVAVYQFFRDIYLWWDFEVAWRLPWRRRE